MAAKTDTLRIIGYARLSRASEESTSIARQRELITQEADKLGATLVGIEDDTDLSGTKSRASRPGLDRALTAVESGEADAVMVWRLDRICRSVGQFMQYLDGGVDIISATEPIDTTSPMGRAMAQVLQVFAELEARTTGIRAAASHEYLRRIGRWAGGVVPFGYRAVDHPEGTGKALEIDPEESAIVRRMAAEALAGDSVYEITRRLNDDGIRTRTGREWTQTTVKRILTADATLGRAVHHGETIRGEDGMPLTPWEPILPVADVMALREAIGYVKRKRDKRGRTVSAERNAGTREKHADYLLAGIVECSGCHRPMTPRKHRGERAYVCPSKHRGQACTTGALVMAAIAEEDVEAEYLGEFGNVPRTEIVETKNNEAGTAELDAAISDIATEMTRPGADVPALAETLTELHARRAEVSTAPATRTTVLHDDTIGEWWATAGTVEKRKMLRSAIESALVVPGVRGKRTKRVRIDWERDDWMGYDD